MIRPMRVSDPLRVAFLVGLLLAPVLAARADARRPSAADSLRAVSASPPVEAPPVPTPLALSGAPVTTRDLSERSSRALLVVGMLGIAFLPSRVHQGTR